MLQVKNYALDAIPNPSKLKQGPVMMELQELPHQTEQLVGADYPRSNGDTSTDKERRPE